MRSKIAEFIYWSIVIVLIGIGLILCSPNPEKDIWELQSQQLIQSYQQVLSTVVTVRGDRISDYNDPNIYGVGTGFFISEQYVLTVAHVINLVDANSIELQLWNEQIILAKKIAIDEPNDLALLQIDPNDIKLYEISKLNFKTDPQIGEMIFIIGSPYLFTNTMSKGIFSRGATTNDDYYGWPWKSEVYLVDGIVGGGNSGSPVFNAKLNVIGIVTGYCGKFSVIIPSNNITRFLKEHNGY